MDKRVFLAFLLSVIVALLYQGFVMRPYYKKKQEELRQQNMLVGESDLSDQDGISSLEEVSVDGEPVAAKKDNSYALKPVKTNQSQNIVKDVVAKWEDIEGENEVVLENSRVKAVFTNVGAGLKRMIVKEDDREDFDLVIPKNPFLQPVYIGVEDDSDAHPIFQIEQISPVEVVFTRTNGVFIQEKIVKLEEDSCEINVHFRLKSLSDQTINFGEGISFSMGSVEKYSQSDKREQLLALAFLDEEKGVVVTKKLGKKKPLEATNGEVLWGCVKNKYYTFICKPSVKFAMLDIPDYTTQDNKKFRASFLRSNPFELGVGEEVVFDFTVYAGPQILNDLKAFKSDFEKSMYFTGWFGPINLILIKSLIWLYSFCKNYGIAIIILTLLIKVLFYPLTKKSFASMGQMQKLQPKVAILKEKYKDNQQKMQQEMMALYKREKVNPMGGCLPMLIQMPIFFGLFRTLSNAYELIDAKFLWIESLSASDKIYTFAWGGGSFTLNILPILMGVTMLIQQKSTTVDPQQQKMMMFMPIIFTFMLYNLPSGLVLYWTLSNVLTIVQQKYIARSK